MRIVARGFQPDTPLPVMDPLDRRLRMTERELYEAVSGKAADLGWREFATYGSRGSKRGFPDLVLWRNRVLFIELKPTDGTIRPDQDATLQSLADAHALVHVWRPIDWITGSIENELRKR